MPEERKAQIEKILHEVFEGPKLVPIKNTKLINFSKELKDMIPKDIYALYENKLFIGSINLSTNKFTLDKKKYKSLGEEFFRKLKTEFNQNWNYGNNSKQYAKKNIIPSRIK
jgi:hypothetical protein